MIGSALTEQLLSMGFGVRNLSRRPRPSSLPRYQEYAWNPKEGTLDTDALEGVRYVINMAGAGINDKRWSHAYKSLIKNSRIDSTRCIVKHLQQLDTLPKFLSFSGTGIYGDHGDDAVDENTDIDLDRKDFLVEVCRQWEAEARKIPCTILRVPPVISATGGVLPTLLRENSRGVIGIVSDQQNYFSWIHITDLISIIIYILQQPGIDTVNACSPQPITNGQMMTKLKSVFDIRGLKLTLPRWLLRLAVGGVADELCKSIRATSSVLEQQSFKFDYPTFDQALEAEKEAIL